MEEIKATHDRTVFSICNDYNDVDVFWQKKAWVDKFVMRDLATRFVEKKNAKHGEDVWVLLFCDNLSAHLTRR